MDGAQYRPHVHASTCCGNEHPSLPSVLLNAHKTAAATPQQCLTQHDIRAKKGGGENQLPTSYTRSRGIANYLGMKQRTLQWAHRAPCSAVPNPLLASRSCSADKLQLWRQSGDKIPLSIRPKTPRVLLTQVSLRSSRNSRYRSWDLALREPALRCFIPALPDANTLWRHGGGKIQLSIGTKAPRRKHNGGVDVLGPPPRSHVLLLLQQRPPALPYTA